MHAIEIPRSPQPADIPSIIHRHLTRGPLANRVDALRDEFQREQFVEIPNFMPPEVFDAAKRDVDYLLDTRGRRRDLLIPSTANTPRNYTNVGRNDVKACSLFIPPIYHCTALRKFLSTIAGETLEDVPFLPEEYLISRLHRKGDTHGWHWDDYTYALIWVFRMPPAGQGGSLEFVRDTTWDKDKPEVQPVLDASVPLERHPPVASAYLLKADTSMHRVSPLHHHSERVIVCFSFATEGDLAKPIAHETMELMYPETCEEKDA
ncbi:MAG: hypothetical protein OXT09_18550 [Myxococcales bacterium]|nr:hypothetical protein [Myxococcales bacterium]